MSENTKPAPIQITNIRDLFTREKAEKGVEIAIYTPTGEETTGRVTVCFSESKVYKERSGEVFRTFGDLDASKPGDNATPEEIAAYDAKKEARDLALAASLVIGWNIDLEFTPANVQEVLYNMPTLRGAVMAYGFRREVFFGSKPTP